VIVVRKDEWPGGQIRNEGSQVLDGNSEKMKVTNEGNDGGDKFLIGVVAGS
jgi:hypothetical protein